MPLYEGIVKCKQCTGSLSFSIVFDDDVLCRREKRRRKPDFGIMIFPCSLPGIKMLWLCFCGTLLLTSLQKLRN